MTATAPAGALGYVGFTPQQGPNRAFPQLRSTEAHRGHRCCLDPSRTGGGRFSLVGTRRVLQGASPTAAGRAAGLGRPTHGVVIPAICKSYGCPCCASRNIRRNRKRAALGTFEGPGVVAMLTGTLDPEHPRYLAALGEAPRVTFGTGMRAPKVRTLAAGAETRASVRFIGRAWSDFVTYARRLEPWWVCGCRRTLASGEPARRHEKGCTIRFRPLEGLAFFKGMELQQNGRAHVHVLIRVDDLETLMAVQSQLRAIADRVGFGGRRSWRDRKGRRRYGFEVERVRSADEAAGYVTKAAGSFFGGSTERGAGPSIAGEVAKERQQRTLPPYTRRASWSRGRRAWAPTWQDAPASPLEWSFARWDHASLTRALEASGLVIDVTLVTSQVAPVRVGGLE